METEKLYALDPFQREFTARVLSCVPAGEGSLVTLDRTAFYPEGGGQPADHGTLGGVPVVDVHEKDGVILHTLQGTLNPGDPASGSIAWARRFDHMQQHSGEHIISGILCADYHCDNVGFHLGAETVTIDYNADLSWQQVLAAEEKANAVIWADRAVEVSYPTQAELDALDYRSKKEILGQVRIVTFPGADCCACCGTHVLRAGQVGLIKALSCQRFREGVRIEILCGERALRYCDMIHEQNRGVAQRLSVKPQDTLSAVERLEGELSAAKLRMAELEDQLIARIAAGYENAGDCLLIHSELRPEAARKLADSVGRLCGGLAAVFSGQEGAYTYALVQAQGQDISPLVKDMNQRLQGRGGGRGGFAQGRVQATAAEIRQFFEKG